MSPSTVPRIGTSALIGTLPDAREGRQRVEEAHPSSRSPHADDAAAAHRHADARTFSSVSSRSCQVRVVMISP
jgi:hypothetical protein